MINKLGKKGMRAIIIGIVLVMGLLLAVFSLGLIDFAREKETAHAATSGYSITNSATCTVTLSSNPNLSGFTWHTYNISTATETAATWQTGTYAKNSTSTVYYLYGQTSQNKTTQTDNCAAMAQGWAAAMASAIAKGMDTPVSVQLRNDWGATLDSSWSYKSYFYKTADYSKGFRCGGLSIGTGANIVLDLYGHTINRNLYNTDRSILVNYTQVINCQTNENTSAGVLRKFTLKDTSTNGQKTATAPESCADASGVLTGVGRITGAASGANGNSSNSTEGGINMTNCQFKFESGAICYNVGYCRSGAIIAASPIDITGGIIVHNHAFGNGGVDDTAGGGMWVGYVDEVNLSGGMIAYNISDGKSGGLHLVSGQVTVNLTGTFVIKNNHSDAWGGGIFINAPNAPTVATIKISGTPRIFNNTAKLAGGGIYQRSATTTIFKVEGNPYIMGNKSGVDANGNIGVDDDNVYFIEGAKVIVTGALTNGASTPQIGVRMQTMGTFTDGFQTYNAGKAANKFFFSDNLSYQVNSSTTLEGQLITAGTLEPAWISAVATSKSSGTASTFTLSKNWTATSNTGNFNETNDIAFGATNNTAGAGGLCVPAGANIVLDLAGKTLSRGLSAAKANGQVITVFGTLTIKDSAGGGKITGGNSSSDYGGGILVSGSGSVNIQSGEISGNKGKNGGGIGFNSSGVLTLIPTTSKNINIKNNTASNNGGAIWLAAASKLNMNKSSDSKKLNIQSNTAANHGGGIYVTKNTNANGSGFQIGGKNIFVNTNRSTTYGLSNVYIADITSVQIAVASAMDANTSSATNSNIGISLPITKGIGTFAVASTASWATNVAGASSELAILKPDQGTLMVKTSCDTSTGKISFNYNDETTMASKWASIVSTSISSKQVERFDLMQDWTPEGAKDSSNNQQVTWFGTGTGFTSNGAIEVPSGANIKINFLNSKKINRNLSAARAGGTVINVIGTLTLMGTGSITGGKTTTTTEGGAITVTGGTVTISDSTITINGNTAVNGGAIYVGSGSVTMTNGVITGNTASSGNGGAAYINSGSFTMSAGTVKSNTASSGNGGAFFLKAGTLTVSAGTIGGSTANKNSAKNGGGIYAEGGTLTVNGGTISYNNATASGGGIWTKVATT